MQISTLAQLITHTLTQAHMNLPVSVCVSLINISAFSPRNADIPCSCQPLSAKVGSLFPTCLAGY